MKSQATIEYVMIVGIVLAIIIPIFYYSSEKANENIKLNQASDAVNTLAKAADTVYSLGPGSKDYVWINIPGGANSSSVLNKTIKLDLYIFGSVSDIHATTKGNVSGRFPYQKGTYKILVQMLEDGIVYIGPVNDTLAPVISNIRPIDGSIVTNSPVTLSGSTDEIATCQYSQTYGFVYGSGTNFQTTGGSYHAISLLLGNRVYTYYIKCNDSFGNFNNDLNQGKTNFTVNTNIDLDNPVITLIEPVNGTLFDDNEISFKYRVNDITSNLSSCTLNIYTKYDSGSYGTTFVTDNSIYEYPPNEEIIETVLNKGNHTWSISCIDSSAQMNIGYSEERWFRVNVTIGEGTESSCPDLCEVNPIYSGGACDANAGCPHISGGVHLPAGDAYCVALNYALPQADTCCCVPK